MNPLALLTRGARAAPARLTLRRSLPLQPSPFSLGVRAFSRSTSAQQGLQLPPWLTLGNVRAYWPQIAIGAGGLVVVYGMSSVMYWVTGTFLSLDFKHVFYIGLGTGVVSCALLGGGAAYFWSRNSISPAQLHRWAVARLASDARVRSALGANVVARPLRAYAVEPGHVSLSRQFAWIEPRAQMLLHVAGDLGEGITTVEAVRKPKGVVFNLLALDTLPAGGPRAAGARAGSPSSPSSSSTLILVHGKEEKLHVQGSLRGFLQMERASYIPQDRGALTDEELAREQAELPDPIDGLRG